MKAPWRKLVKKISSPRWVNVTRDQRKLHKEELCDVYLSTK
jgi:hypothetical protein